MASLEHLPIAITMGDPCGIGPEIVAKLYADTTALPPTLVLGDEGVVRRAVQLLNSPLYPPVHPVVHKEYLPAGC